MPTLRTGPTLARCHPPTDAALIERFVADRDEPAFAELVRRHGPAVLAVCRRTLGHHHDADDAFQATFLVLARKAGRVAFHADIGGWLVAVAVRAAQRVRTDRGRRLAHERTLPTLPDRPARETPPDTDAATVLAAVARLPDPYRAAVVLCELEGRPRAEAARRLGVPEGTLSSRLAEARRRLARRLGGRAAVLAGVVGPVPAALARQVIGMATASAVPSILVSELAEGMMHTTILAKWKLAAMAVVAAVGLALAGDRPPEKMPDPVPVTPAAKAIEPRLYFTSLMHGLAAPGDDPAKPVIRILRTAADGTEDAPQVFAGRGGLGASRVFHTTMPGALSPDARHVVYTAQGFDDLAAKQKPAGGGVFVEPLDGSAPPRLLPTMQTGPSIGMTPVAWTPDGSSVIVGEYKSRTNPFWGDPVVVYRKVDVRTGAATVLDLPANSFVLDVSPDGTSYLLQIVHGSLFGDREMLVVYTTAKGGWAYSQILDPEMKGSFSPARFSPDGRRVAYRRFGPGQTGGMFVHDRDTGKTVRLVGSATEVEQQAAADQRPGVPHLFGLAWSPDGSRVAFSVGVPNVDKTPTTRVVIADAASGKTVGGFEKATWKVSADESLAVPFTLIGWR